MRKAVTIAGLCLLVQLAFAIGLSAQPRESQESQSAPTEEASSWRLRADHFTHDQRQGVYTARGNVSLHYQDQSIFADYMRLDSVTRQAVLEGRVRIEQGQDWLECERAFLELEKQTGTIEHGNGFLAENHFYFSGEIMEKLGPQTYHIERGSFTTCDGERPSWHFRTGDLRITVDGYGFAKHSRFHLGPVPVLYSPYLVFPAKKTRQTGLLLPRMGKSDLRGYDIDLPFFWAIHDSADATFYSHYMSKRGLMAGGEFRYAASKESFGILRFDYLNDQEDSTTLRENFSDLYLRRVAPGFDGEYSKRWWLRSKQNFALPFEAQGKLDLDFVSDRDYLREFDTGFSSWRESNEIFENRFGRGLINDESITTRESSLLLNKIWPTQALNFEARYFYNLNTVERNFTQQQLPLILYTAARQQLLGSPFFFQANGAYVNYWRDDGTRGHRLDLNPRLALPLRLFPYLEVEPSVGAQGTAYLIERYDEPEDSSVREKTFQSRELFDARLEASSEIGRVFDVGLKKWSRMNHVIRPKVVYEFLPEVSQGKFPLFDTNDRVSSRNRLTYSLTNFFVARLDKDQGKVAYQDLARLKFEQFYDIVEPEGEFVLSTTSGRRPFSNIFTQLDLTPKRYLNLTYKNEWSPYDGEFKRHDVLASLWDPRGDKASISYRMRRDEGGHTLQSEIDARLTVNLWGGVSVHFRENYRFDTNENLKTEYHVRIDRQCWGISFGYIDEAEDTKFLVGFTLEGLGGFEWGD